MLENLIDNEDKRTKVNNVLSKVYHLPSLPFIIDKVNKIVDNPQSSTAYLSQVISKDQGLSTKILSVANSPFYGFPRRVSTIDFAIIILGFNHVKNITIAFSIMDALSDVRSKYFDQKKYWLHSMMAATAAKRISSDLGFNLGGEAFTSGLLHDLGIPIICKYLPDETKKIFELVENFGMNFIEAEFEVLGLTHFEIGFNLIERWNLPFSLSDVIHYHHFPSDASDNRVLSAIIHLADYMTNALDIGGFNWDTNYTLDKSILKTLNLGDENYINYFVESYRQLFISQIESITLNQ